MDQGTHEIEEQVEISVLTDGAPAVHADASQPKSIVSGTKKKRLEDWLSSNTKEKSLDDWLQEIDSQLDQQVANPNQSFLVPKRSEGPSIFRVAGKTGKQVVNIGRLLYVGDLPNVPIDAEMMWHYVGFMKRWVGLNPSSYIRHFIDKTDMIRSYYAEDICPNSWEISVSLLLGSCFILVALLIQGVQGGVELIGLTKENIKNPKDQPSQELLSLYQQVKQHHMAVILDMLKLENQIPWFAIEVAYRNSSLIKDVEDPFEAVWWLFRDLYPLESRSCSGDDSPKDGFKHLLHIFHWTRTLRDRHLDVRIQESELYIPSATDLLESNTNFIRDGSFSVGFDRVPMSAVMKLGRLHIFNYSSELLCNLIDFEQNYLECGGPIIDYMVLMVRLLQSATDVKLLKRNRIVANTMKTDKEVLNFIQELRSKVEDAHIGYNLIDLSWEVREAHESSANRRYAEFKKQYCSNPWITISVIGAILLFILTVIQAVYGALSYYKA